MSTTITILVYIALAIMPPSITFGLPSCNGTTTGLTERYNPAHETLYVDECRNGTITATNLPIIDMTTSVVIIMTSAGEVTIQLPQQQSQLPFPTDRLTTIPSSGKVREGQPTTVQSSQTDNQDNQPQLDPDQESNCDKVNLFLDDCVMGPLP